MRARHVFAVVAVLIIAAGVKLFFFPPMKAEADLAAASHIDVLQMQRDHPNLPIQKIHDATFVFADGD